MIHSEEDVHGYFSPKTSSEGSESDRDEMLIGQQDIHKEMELIT